MRIGVSSLSLIQEIPNASRGFKSDLEQVQDETGANEGKSLRRKLPWRVGIFELQLSNASKERWSSKVTKISRRPETRDRELRSVAKDGLTISMNKQAIL